MMIMCQKDDIPLPRGFSDNQQQQQSCSQGAAQSTGRIPALGILMPMYSVKCAVFVLWLAQHEHRELSLGKNEHKLPLAYNIWCVT